EGCSSGAGGSARSSDFLACTAPDVLRSAKRKRLYREIFINTVFIVPRQGGYKNSNSSDDEWLSIVLSHHKKYFYAVGKTVKVLFTAAAHPPIVWIQRILQRYPIRRYIARPCG